MPGTTRLAAATIALALAAAGCGKSAPSPVSSFDGAAFPPGVAAPPFSLNDQMGDSVSLTAQRGHVVVLTFVSSTCRSCLLVAQQIRGALDELGSGVHAKTMFVSTSARADTPARVARFLARASLSGRAAYLTGNETQLRSVWRAYRIQPRSEDAVTILLIDKHGVERVAFGLEQITPESLSHDIRLLEAG